MKLIVWDFHGTLEKGNENAVLEMSNRVLENYGYSIKMTESDCKLLYGKKWYQYFEYLLPDEPQEAHLKLQDACFEFSDSHPEIIAKYIKPSDYAIEVLEKLNLNHDQILISNTKPSSLEIFLKAVGMKHIFTQNKAFATDAHIKDKTKFDVLNEYLLNNKYDEIVVIGDSEGDIDLGQSVGAKTFLYAHPGQEFKDLNSDYKINDLREIINII